MPYLLMLGTILIRGSQGYFTKFYNIRCKRPNPYAYAMVSTFFALLFTMASVGFKLEFTPELLLYAIPFGIMYVAAIAGSNLALAVGPFFLTGLFESFSLMIPILYGIIFLNEPASIITIIGLVLLSAAFVISNADKVEKNARITPLWFVYMLICVIGNGTTTTILKVQQINFSGAYKNEFLAIGIGIAFVLMTVLAWFKSENFLEDLRGCALFAPFTGLANGIGNIALMFATAVIPSSVFFPTEEMVNKSIGYVASRVLFKEKISKCQKIGYIIGVVSVILLNL